MRSDRFYEFKTTSRHHAFLKDKAPKLRYETGYGDIVLAQLPPENLEQDTKIVRLIKDFGLDKTKQTSIFMMCPNTFYHWHIDGRRKCAINMVLDGWDSLVLTGRRKGPYYEHLEHVPYTLSKYMLLNTSVPHTVINFSQPRYVLSLGLPPSVTFEDILKYSIDNDV